MNVAQDVAVCAECDEVIRLSESSKWAVVPEGFDINDPPPGAWFRKNEEGWEIGASTRSYIALFLVPFTCVWSGLSLGGIYGSQIFSGEFDPSLSLFGIPFVVGTIFLGTFALITSIGRVQVTVRQGKGVIFTGIGRLGYKRKFNWADIERVEEKADAHDSNGRRIFTLALVGKVELRFAMMPNAPRKAFLLNGLRSLI